MHAKGGISRLAPSPTGALHLGHACTFVANWLLARKSGWRLLLRLDDLDAPRVQSSGHDVLDTLRWLGLDWDGEPIRQSARLDRYRAAMHALAQAGVVYESPHTRSEVREAAAAVGAPHEGEGHARFPDALRPSDRGAWRFVDAAMNHRVHTLDEGTTVHDQVMGSHEFHVQRDHGDFLVWTKAGVPSYQLACAVDDGELGVTDVVRGADLLESAALQTRLLRALRLPEPRWWHMPLVRNAQGERLAKRDGAEGLAGLQRDGVPADRVRGLVAWWIGKAPLAPITRDALLQRCEPDALLRSLRAMHASGGPRVHAATLAWLHGDDAAADTLATHVRG